MTDDAAAALPPEPLATPELHDGGDVGLLALIDRMAGLLERSDLSELEVESGGTGLILRKELAAPSVAGPAAPAIAASPGMEPRPPGNRRPPAAIPRRPPGPRSRRR